MEHNEVGTYGTLSLEPATTFAELRQRVQDALDNISQDDILHLYDLFHERIYPSVAARVGYNIGLLGETVWAPLTVPCRPMFQQFSIK